MNNPAYEYMLNGGTYYIYKMSYKGNSSIGEKLDEPYFTEEDAKKETYRLNGWEYKPKK